MLERSVGTTHDAADAPVVAPRARPSSQRARALLRPVRRQWSRPAVWRATAGLAAVALAALLFLIVPGSVRMIRIQPLGSTARLPAWSRACAIDSPPPDDATKLAFCARVQGRVVASIAKEQSDDGERHVLVTGGFHVTLVELRGAIPTPALGSRITAVGPLQRAGYGLRELIALSIRHS